MCQTNRSVIFWSNRAALLCNKAVVHDVMSHNPIISETGEVNSLYYMLFMNKKINIHLNPLGDAYLFWQ